MKERIFISKSALNESNNSKCNSNSKIENNNDNIDKEDNKQCIKLNEENEKV